MCWAYGWGQTEDTGGEGFLKQVELEIGSSEECMQEYGNKGSQEYAICAGKKKGEDTCRGDRYISQQFQIILQKTNPDKIVTPIKLVNAVTMSDNDWC